MFRGSSFHTIDAKGRVIIPARFKDVIKADGGEGLMISRMDNCLLGFVFSEWRKIETKILAMAEKNDNMRRFRRVFIGGAFECNCDKQGRILIPPSLRQYADFADFVEDLANSLDGVTAARSMFARGQYDPDANIFTASKVGIYLLEP